MSDEPYIEPPVDITHAEPELVAHVRGYFAAKNGHDPDAMMAFFAADVRAYSDATLGWVIEGCDAIRDSFAHYMPKWGKGRSYPLRILGNADSAVVIASDTPELFGGEIRHASAVDFISGKVVRWVDYWDSSAFPSVPYHLMAKHGPFFPADFGEPASRADPRLTAAVDALHAALTQGDDVHAVLTYDAVWEDMALRTQLIGRSAIGRMLERSRKDLPFGPGASVRHVLGGGTGGGYEWIGRDGSAVRVGLTAVELDEAGRISRATVVYDGRHLSTNDRRALVAAVAD